MSLKLLITILLQVFLLTSCAHKIAQFRKGPYLVYPNEKGKMTVLWQINDEFLKKVKTGTLKWGLDKNYNHKEEITYYGDGQFKYTIAKLPYKKKIYYKVEIGDLSYESSFLSPPTRGDKDLIFYAGADSRSNPEILNKLSKKVLDDINIDENRRQTLFLHGGDWVNHGATESNWDNQIFGQKYTYTRELLSRIPWMGVRGNHEDDGKVFKKYWPYNHKDLDGLYYSFDYGPMHVVVIDQYVSFAPGSKQYSWIEKDLSNTMKPFKVVLLHALPWSSGVHKDEKEMLDAQKYLHPLFVSYNVRIALGGHNHLYNRSIVDKVQYITAGSMGAPLYKPTKAYHQKAQDSSHHFCIIEYSSGVVKVDVKRLDGSLIETFTFRIDW